MSTQLFHILEITYAADYDNIEKKKSGVGEQTSLFVTNFHEQIPQYIMITNDRSKL